MTEFDEKLRELQAQAARQEKLRAVVEELYRSIERLEKRERELAAIRAREQGDVDKLEGRTLAAFFYGLTGSREDRLEQMGRETEKARAERKEKLDALILQA